LACGGREEGKRPVKQWAVVGSQWPVVSSQWPVAIVLRKQFC
jgi:hypothetical protein